MWDSTAWSNGSHTYVVTVTDSSNRTATSTTLTVNTVNYAPFVEWSSGNNQTVTGSFVVSAVATPQRFGSAFIKKWCLTVDGSPVTSNVVYRDYGSDSLHYATFNADTGCWSSSSNLAYGKFVISTETWTNASRTLSVVIIDSSNRTANDSLTFTTNNPQPTTKIIGISQGSTVRGSATFGFEVYHPGATEISNWCITINSTVCASTGTNVVSAAAAVSSRSASIDTSMWRNGVYTARSTATDSAGRRFDSGVVSFTVNNPPASASQPSISKGKPKWSDKTVKATVLTSTTFASEVRVYWGTSKKKLKSASWSAGSVSATLSGLKPKTVYYAKVQAIGPNGNSETGFVKFTSPAIPPKPKPQPRSGGGSGGGSGGYGWTPYFGMNLEEFQDAAGFDPATFDCSGRGRMNLWSRNWWIVGVRGGAFAISKSRSSCS